MEQTVSAERIKVKLKSPNPLFEKWLLQWHEEEVDAGKIETIYSKALESLRKFPLVLNSGFECIILEHFDKQLCLKLSHKLDEYEATNGKECIEGRNVQNMSKGVSKNGDNLDDKKEDTNNLSSPKRSLKNEGNKQEEKALESLRKFPLVLNSGFECIILEHFDKQLCLKLSHKLDEYEATNGKECIEGRNVQNMSKGVSKNGDNLDDKKEDTNNLSSPKRSLKNEGNKQEEKKKIKKRVYIPMKRSAAFGILLGLLLKENESNYIGFSTKAEVISAAQHHTDVSMKKAVSGGFYTGWSSMSQLVSKGLVEKFSNPAKYKLTEEGRMLAIRLKNDCSIYSGDEPQDPILSLESASELIAPPKPRGRKTKNQEVMAASSQSENKSGHSSQNHEFTEGSSNSQKLSDNLFQNNKVVEGCNFGESQDFTGILSSQSQEFETQEMIFLPNNFDIVLLVDNQETEGKEKKDESEILVLLERLNINYEVRGLKVGDYLWVARDCIGREMVLPYVIERKRFDDLSRSIKDGRFHEQKFRLKLCGLQNKIYLVESHGFEHTQATEYLYQAITNTMVCDKFTVRFSKNLKDTARYLATVTKIIKTLFQNKTLFSCKKDSISETIDLKDDVVSLLSYQEFSQDMEKTKELTAREDFALQLVQLKGMSSDKAWAITEVYPTPKSLIEGFLYSDAENVISELRSGLMKNKIGPQIASVLRIFYTSKEFMG